MESEKSIQHLVDIFNELFGFDVRKKTKQKKYVRARQAIVRLFLFHEYSYTRIGRILGCSRQNVKIAEERYHDLMKSGDDLIEEYWSMIEDMKL